jgi:hypothetical protein
LTKKRKREVFGSRKPHRSDQKKERRRREECVIPSHVIAQVIFNSESLSVLKAEEALIFIDNNSFVCIFPVIPPPIFLLSTSYKHFLPYSLSTFSNQPATAD